MDTQPTSSTHFVSPYREEPERAKFFDLVHTLRDCLPPCETGTVFLVSLVDLLIENPMTEEQEADAREGIYNPLRNLSPSALQKIYSGERKLAASTASIICSRYDGDLFVYELNNLPDGQKELLQTFLSQYGIIAPIEHIGEAMNDILHQILLGLSHGIDDPPVKLSLHRTDLNFNAFGTSRITFEDGKLIIDNIEVKLPVQLNPSDVQSYEAGYVSKLCEAYADALEMDSIDVEDISNFHPKYSANFKEQRKAFLSAESIQRSLREVYENGQDEFDILKEDALHSVEITYQDDYPNGFERLKAVLKHISGVPLSKSRLMLISNLIGSLERYGLVQILANENKLPSWIDPFKESCDAK